VYGNCKRISASIAFSEKNRDTSKPGKNVLRFVASSSDQADVLLGKVLYENMKGVR